MFPPQIMTTMSHTLAVSANSGKGGRANVQEHFILFNAKCQAEQTLSYGVGDADGPQHFELFQG